MADAPPPRLQGLAWAARSLSHPSRLYILQLLAQEGPLAYGEIERRTGLSKPTIRQHLKILRRAGIVERGSAARAPFAASCGRTPHAHAIGLAVTELHRDIDAFLWELRVRTLGRPTPPEC